MGSFETVQDFWCYYNNIPTPDRIFFGSGALFLPKAFDTGCTVNGLALFRSGVLPAWEDARNMRGCDLCVRQTFTPEQLRLLWRDLLLSLVNEELGANVVGVRLTYKRDRRTGGIVHKVEVWLDDFEVEVPRAHLATLLPGTAFDVVSHHIVACVQKPHPPLRNPRGGRRGRG